MENFLIDCVVLLIALGVAALFGAAFKAPKIFRAIWPPLWGAGCMACMFFMGIEYGVARAGAALAATPEGATEATRKLIASAYFPAWVIVALGLFLFVLPFVVIGAKTIQDHEAP